MKYLSIAILLLLCSCESEEETKTKWIANCSKNDFTVKQCVVLYSIAKSSSDANDSAASASIMSGAAMGLAAGGRR